MGTPPSRTRTPEQLGLAAEPPAAAPGGPAAAHLRVAVGRLLRVLLAHEPAASSGHDPEAVHQMRVSTRRLRSVLKLSGPLLGPRAQDVRAELGWLAALLGDVRDDDVLIARVQEIAREFAARDRDAAGELLSVLVAERGTARGRLTKALSSARYARLLRSLAQLTEADSAASDVPGKALLRRLRKPYRRLTETAAALPAEPADDELHALRIRGKRLRYTAELARTAAAKQDRKRLKKLIGAAKDLQRVLGEHQDAVLAAERMHALAATRGGEVGFVAGRIAERELARRARPRADWPAAVARIDAAARKLR